MISYFIAGGAILCRHGSALVVEVNTVIIESYVEFYHVCKHCDTKCDKTNGAACTKIKLCINNAKIYAWLNLFCLETFLSLSTLCHSSIMLDDNIVIFQDSFSDMLPESDILGEKLWV